MSNIEMSYAEFRKRVNHNTKILKKALADNKPLITVLPELYTLENKPGDLHSSVIVRNAHDMLPAVYLGLLINTKNNGIDAYKIKKDGSVEIYELKTAEIRSSQVWRGPQGGLYTGTLNTPRAKCSIKSSLNASYSFSTFENIDTKRMKTVLMIADTDGPDGYFDAWELDGNTVVDQYIKGRVGNVTIKLGSFMLNGKQAKTVVPIIGYDKWENSVQMIAQSRRFYKKEPV